MEHFICTGECQGVSDKPGTCQAKTCAKHAQELLPCNCKDGKHFDRQQKTTSKEAL